MVPFKRIFLEPCRLRPKELFSWIENATSNHSPYYKSCHITYYISEFWNLILPCQSFRNGFQVLKWKYRIFDPKLLEKKFSDLSSDKNLWNKIYILSLGWRLDMQLKGKIAISLSLVNKIHYKANLRAEIELHSPNHEIRDFCGRHSKSKWVTWSFIQRIFL
jgi:hypothetical protein